MRCVSLGLPVQPRTVSAGSLWRQRIVCGVKAIGADGQSVQNGRLHSFQTTPYQSLIGHGGCWGSRENKACPRGTAREKSENRESE